MVPKLASLEAATDELQREFNVRTRCFPRWIDDGRLSGTDAKDRLDRLYTALTVLKEVLSKETKEQMLRESLIEAPILTRDVTSSGDLTAETK